ncbi:MAG: ATP-binding protein [Phycisphaerales bacterium]|jgi:anti-sigma regulatory factor (Ser/Thr protein kinase)|nr:ATP-binding protein [Phycisphaerales bacterium]
MKPKPLRTTASGTLTIPASPAWNPTIRQLVIGICRTCQLTDRDAGLIALAVDEAMSNVHRHGYGGSHEEHVTVTITAMKAMKNAPFHISICLQDNATQIPLDEIRSRNLSELKPGGLGVHLIQSIMDRAVWSHRPEGGMQLILEKSIDPLATRQRHQRAH